MKKIITFIIMNILLININSFQVQAAECTPSIQTEYVFASDFKIAPPEENALIIYEESYFEDGNNITITSYQLSDGSIVTDTVESTMNTRSSSGSDTVTRSKTETGWGTLTVTASFDWYTEFPFSYVRCTYVDAYFTNSGHTEEGQITKGRSNGYLSIGNAYAYANISLSQHNPELAINVMSLRIECTDTGTVFDY